MKKILVFIIGVALIFVGCRKTTSSEIKLLEGKETTFLAEYLQSKFGDSISKNIPLVIMDTPSIKRLTIGENPEKVCLRIAQQAETIDQRVAEAALDFCAKNTDDQERMFIGTIPVNHVMLSKEQEALLFDTDKNGGRDGWKVYREAYLGSSGLITLSRPGFSKDGNISVVYMGHQSNWLVGHGRIYVYEKKNEQWRDTRINIGPQWAS